MCLQQSPNNKKMKIIISGTCMTKMMKSSKQDMQECPNRKDSDMNSNDKY